MLVVQDLETIGKSGSTRSGRPVFEENLDDSVNTTYPASIIEINDCITAYRLWTNFKDKLDQLISKS